MALPKINPKLTLIAVDGAPMASVTAMAEEMGVVMVAAGAGVVATDRRSASADFCRCRT